MQRCAGPPNTEGSKDMISYFINRRIGFVYLFVEGRPTLDDYDQSLRTIYADADFSRDLNWICDFLRADLPPLITLELLKFARFVEHVQISGDPSIAVVSPVEHVATVADFVESHLVDQHIGVFGHETEAYQWMADLAQPAEKQQLRAL